MLPSEWSGHFGPEYFELPADLGRFLQPYLHDLDGRRPFQGVVRSAIAGGSNLAMVESDYIDADYRDEFAHFYAQTFRPLPDRCHRLHFINQGANGSDPRYVGFSVMRPVTGRPVSRTMLAPPPSLEPYVSCTARSRASPYGYRFSLDGFPFISQDYQYGVCAHAAIWMIAHYFHLRFRRPRIYLSDIVEGARRYPGYERHTPSPGLSREQISAALDALDMAPIAYRLDALPDELEGESEETIACRYLNSRLPVVLLAGTHARVLIGYGAAEDGTLFFVCNDDAAGPYQVTQPGVSSEPNGESHSSPSWDHLIVPTPGRIYLTGEAAESEGAVTLKAELERRPGSEDLVRAWEAGDLRLRTYVVEAAEYKRRLRDRELPVEVAAWHARVSLSHWVWVVELQDRAAAATSPRCVVGEIVIDATSDDLHPNYLMANLPGVVMRWPYLGSNTESTDTSQREQYLTGSALHA